MTIAEDALLKLYKTRDELRLLADQVPVRICVVDRNLRVLWDMGAGFSGSPCAGKRLTDVFPASPDRDHVLEGVRKALLGESSELEVTISGRTAQLRLVPYRNESDAIIGVLGGALDVSDRKRAEQAMRKSQRQLIDAQTLAHVGSWERDPRTGQVDMSDEARRIFLGDDPRPLDNDDQYLSCIHPDDQHLVLDAREKLQQGSGPRELQYRIVRPDGAVRWTVSRVQVERDDRGQLVRVVGTILDVTERKQAEEERARRAQQQAAVAQLGLSAMRGDELKPLFEEAAALVSRTLGVEYGVVLEWLPEKELMEFRAGAGPWIDEIVRRVTVPTAPGFMAWFYTRSQQPVVASDLVHETRFAPCELLLEHGVKSSIVVPIGGKERAFGVLEANCKEVRVFTDDEIHFVWSMANVLATAIEQKRAAAELRERREQLQSLSHKLIEAQEAERRAVARELHDDFGQVLTAIKLNLHRKQTDPAESIALVDGALARMRDLAQDLRPPLLDDMGLEASLSCHVEREAKRAGLGFHLRVDPLEARPPPAVETSCFRVAQEALTNVIRHARAGRVEVALGVTGGALRLRVSDDGKGFDVAAARKRAARGESQGLLSMQERVALAGGKLAIESAPGRGTVVHAYFPLAGGSLP